MRVAVPKETVPGERRVALVPEIVKKLTASGFDVAVERGAGEGASFSDAEYEEAGARVVGPDELFSGVEGVVKVQRPSAEEIAQLPDGSILIGFLQPLTDGLFLVCRCRAPIQSVMPTRAVSPTSQMTRPSGTGP